MGESLSPDRDGVRGIGDPDEIAFLREQVRSLTALVGDLTRPKAPEPIVPYVAPEGPPDAVTDAITRRSLPRTPERGHLMKEALRRLAAGESPELVAAAILKGEDVV